MSPSQHSALKRVFSIQIPQTIYRKVEKVAAKNGVSVNEQITIFLRNDVFNVALTAEDEAIIEERIEARIEQRKRDKQNKGGK